MDRRRFLTAAASVATVACAQDRPAVDLYERVDTPGRIARPPLATTQDFVDSRAPKAEASGRWIACAPLALPRSEMGEGAALADRLHVVGGYGAQRVDRGYHAVYDPGSDRWSDAAPLPRGANHIGIAAVGNRIYAIGGFVEQNRRPHDQCFFYEESDDRWHDIARLPQAAGSIGACGLDGRLHAVGGATGDTSAAKKSLDWHLVYEEAADRWVRRAPLPTARDHVGIVASTAGLHVIGGRVDSFNTNSDLHHVYRDEDDRWTSRRPLPTPRSGHAAEAYRARIFVMGGEGTERVFGQLEGYDIAADRWAQYAPMPTPRHGFAAAVLSDGLHVAGGGAVNGGGVQTAVHERFVL
jgi:N-acetylneuraminic acid mutarotase